MNFRVRIPPSLFSHMREPKNRFQKASKLEANLHGRVFVLTLGETGVCFDVARILYERGARIVAIGNRPMALQENPSLFAISDAIGSFDLVHCDLRSMTSIRTCAKQIIAKYERIDALINCSELDTKQVNQTKDGFEVNWAVNYLGPILLIHHLFDRMREAKNSRIINLTADPASLDRFGNSKFVSELDFASKESSYLKSKLSLSVMSVDLARRFENIGITVNCLCPGRSRSNFWTYLKVGERFGTGAKQRRFALTQVNPHMVAEMAISPDFENFTGGCFAGSSICAGHSAEQIPAMRAQLAAVTENALQKWL